MRRLVAAGVMGLCIGAAVETIAPELTTAQHLVVSLLLFVAIRVFDWSARR